MSRGATFAKRQRETELKDRQKQKEARRMDRRTSPNSDQKGPVIAWDEQVEVVITPDNSDGSSLVPRDDTARTTPE